MSNIEELSILYACVSVLWTNISVSGFYLHYMRSSCDILSKTGMKFTIVGIDENGDAVVDIARNDADTDFPLMMFLGFFFNRF